MGNTEYGVGGGIVWVVFWFTLGYFMYNGVSGGLACVLLSIVMGVTVIIALIPFIGFGVQYLTNTTYILPFMVDFTHITASWVTTLMLALSVVGGVIVTFMTSMAIILLWKGR